MEIVSSVLEVGGGMGALGSFGGGEVVSGGCSGAVAITSFAVSSLPVGCGIVGAIGALLSLAHTASTSTVVASALMAGFLSSSLNWKRSTWSAIHKLSYRRQ